LKKQGKIVIWPVNVDSAKTRSQGRKLPKSLCIPDPKMNEIASAASTLQLNPEHVPDRARPRTWWTKTGLVVADKKTGRIDTLKEISKEISRSRQPKSK